MFVSTDAIQTFITRCEEDGYSAGMILQQLIWFCEGVRDSRTLDNMAILINGLQHKEE